MVIETADVLTHHRLPGAYRILTLKSPKIAPQVQPGQFVHLRVPRLEEAVLRRPFSVFKAEPETLSILYKIIGKGTQAMDRLRAGDAVNLLGPLGNGFPAIGAESDPVLIAGGYGMAALYLLAQRSPVKGWVFVGGAGADDIVCVDDFLQLDWEVRIATEDGSKGKRGLVTALLDTWLAKERGSRKLEFFAGGPIGMLQAVSERAQAGGWTAWLSLDRHMGCGMGACLACVQKVSTRDGFASGGRVQAPPAGNPPPAGDEGAWTWARVCTEGPVFECRQIVWEASDQ